MLFSLPWRVYYCIFYLSFQKPLSKKKQKQNQKQATFPSLISSNKKGRRSLAAPILHSALLNHEFEVLERLLCIWSRTQFLIFVPQFVKRYQQGTAQIIAKLDG